LFYLLIDGFHVLSSTTIWLLEDRRHAAEAGALNAVRSKTGVQVGAIFDVRALLTPPLAAERMVRLSSNGFSCRNACLNENDPT
jgi:hypothetical protein